MGTPSWSMHEQSTERGSQKDKLAENHVRTMASACGHTIPLDYRKQAAPGPVSSLVTAV